MNWKIERFGSNVLAEGKTSNDCNGINNSNRNRNCDSSVVELRLMTEIIVNEDECVLKCNCVCACISLKPKAHIIFDAIAVEVKRNNRKWRRILELEEKSKIL